MADLDGPEGAGRRVAGTPPLRLPFFYGWVVLAIAMTGAFLSGGTSQLFMGVMLKPISEDTGWSRTLVTGAITAGTVTSGLVSPFLGMAADRHGPRVLLAGSAVVVSAALFVLAGIEGVAGFYIAYVIARSLSQACFAGVVPAAAMANWFLARRGRAMGMVTMCGPLGTALLAGAAQYLIQQWGWRSVFLGLGVVVAVLLVGPAAVFMRRRPEDVGLLPDGATGAGVAAAQGRPRRRGSEYSFTLRQAVRTRSLWLLIACQVASSLATSTVAVHQVAYYTDLGLAPGFAALALSLFGLAGAFSSGVWGVLADRFSERKLTMLLMALAALSMGSLLFVRSESMALLASTLVGLTGRGEGALLSVIMSRYFGRGHFGSISGLATPFHMAGLGLGPLVGAVVFDWTGAYQGTFTALISLYLLSGVLIFFARPPRPPLPPSSPTV